MGQTAYPAISDSLDASTAAPSTQLASVPLTVGVNADQQDPQQTSDFSGRFVTRDMAQVPGISKAQLDVRMVGQEIAGNHVVGHLATLANPVGRVQLALPPNGCGTREVTTVTAKSHRPFCKLAINAGYFNVTDGACIGYDAQGRLIIVQVDGSIAVGDNKRGMDMKEVANLLIQHGAVEAINLDGGGSSAMAHNGVLVNYPSDNRPPSCDKSGLFQCERPVST